MSQPLKVSLGCGKRQIPGFVGLDNANFGWNQIWDAEKDALPFGDNSVDLIEAHNFIEHIERRHWRKLFNECHRVLKPTGILEFSTPDAGKDINIAMADITHVSLFVMGTLQYLTGERPRNADYGFKKWMIVIARHYDEKDSRVAFVRLRPQK